MKSKESVLIALFTTATAWVHPSIPQFVHAAASERDRRTRILTVYGVVPVSSARNRAVREFLKSDFDWLLMLDADMVPAPGLLSIVDVAEGRDIVVPRMLCLSAGTITPAWVQRGLEHDGPWLELARAGTGALFVRRRVFEEMPKPWFNFEFDEDGLLLVGEDNNFCDRARSAGFRVWLHDDPAFEVGHCKPVNLSHIAPALRRLKDTLPESENELRWLDADAEFAGG